MPFYLLGVFAPSIVSEFGWSWSQVMAGFAIVSAGMIVTGPIIGTLVDRLGARVVLLPSTLMFALAFGTLAWSTGSLFQYYATWALMALVGVGTSPIAWTRVINATFTRRRGLAIGIGLAGGPIFGIVGKPLAAYLIAEFGWRGAIMAIAAMPIAVAVPLIWFAIREITLTPQQAAVAGQGLTVRAAASGRAFWMIILTTIIMGVIGGSVSLHLERILATTGFSALTIIQITPILGAGVLLGRFGSGWALDHLGPSLVAAATAIISAVGTALLIADHGPLPAAFAIACMGISGGAIYAALSIMTVQLYGIRHSGAIFGIFVSVTVASAGTGPLLFALLFERTGNYHLPLALATGGGLLIAAVQFLLHFVPDPRTAAAMPAPQR
ncbi:MAG: MFS transporter [Rhizorhabdus sp.]|nr:MFS transporter [Rhizorhabdus sp.]